MKYVLILLLILLNRGSLAQTNDTLNKKPNKVSNFITFIAKIDIANATKDGVYVNGYVVNLSYEQAKKLNGKMVRITGKVTIERGLGIRDRKVVTQGREKDTKHIESPKIEIVKN